MSDSPNGTTEFDQRPIFVFSSPTTPNGDLHLGHLGGPYLGADAYARFQRLTGATVFHIAGSDDFQSYVAGAARRDGRTPAETAAHYSAEILATHRLMDVEIDEYTVSGADPSYPGRVQEFFARIAAADRVRVAEGPALFDGETGQYLYEVDVSGGCPTCGHPTGGNMCEECGEPNICSDLIEPKAGTSDAPPRPGRIARYTLDLGAGQSEIEEHYRLGRVPARVKELAARLFARRPFELPITHPGEWGVPPADTAGDDTAVDGQVIWVWIDMAYRFLHGIESIGRRRGESWQALAPQPDWKIVHFLGYDNTFYHALFVPSMYRLAFPDWHPDIDYNLNEFSLLEGSKFSTSRRHAIWGKDILSPDTVDAVRCYLSWMRPEGRRTNFVQADYRAFVNEVLVAGWQRWLNELGGRVDMLFEGSAPEAGELKPEHRAFLQRLNDRLAAVGHSLGTDDFSLNRATEQLVGIVTDARRFSAEQSPAFGLPTWRQDAADTIALELAAARLLASGSVPVMPRFAGRLQAALGLEPVTSWPAAVELVPPGTPIALTTQEFFQPVQGEIRTAADQPAADQSAADQQTTVAAGR